jgi:hypothetical protein
MKPEMHSTTCSASVLEFSIVQSEEAVADEDVDCDNEDCVCIDDDDDVVVANVTEFVGVVCSVDVEVSVDVDVTEGEVSVCGVGAVSVSDVTDGEDRDEGDGDDEDVVVVVIVAVVVVAVIGDCKGVISDIVSFFSLTKANSSRPPSRFAVEYAVYPPPTNAKLPTTASYPSPSAGAARPPVAPGTKVKEW